MNEVRDFGNVCECHQQVWKSSSSSSIKNHHYHRQLVSHNNNNDNSRNSSTIVRTSDNRFASSLAFAAAANNASTSELLLLLLLLEEDDNRNADDLGRTVGVMAVMLWWRPPVVWHVVVVVVVVVKASTPHSPHNSNNNRDVIPPHKNVRGCIILLFIIFRWKWKCICVCSLLQIYVCLRSRWPCHRGKCCLVPIFSLLAQQRHSSPRWADESRESGSTIMKKQKRKKRLANNVVFLSPAIPCRGIEPRSPAWQAGILATILTRINEMRGKIIVNKYVVLQ